MGFLDHTTNSIIIDAVLTERGRELLARNDGSFKIDSFAFGDDEVDYTNILKYGTDMGKEKIEKNTPIFEAQTNENTAIKYNNITLSSATTRLLYIPILYVDTNTMSILENNPAKPANIQLDSSSTTLNRKTITLFSTLPFTSGQASIDNNLVDTIFEVRFNSLLLGLYNSNGDENITDFVDKDENLISTYSLSKNSTVAEGIADSWQGFILKGRRKISFDIGISPQFENSFFEKFGVITSSGTTTGTINTFLEITGTASGSRMIIPFTIIL
jgi:hypothetical protein